MNSLLNSLKLKWIHRKRYKTLKSMPIPLLMFIGFYSFLGNVLINHLFYKVGPSYFYALEHSNFASFFTIEALFVNFYMLVFLLLWFCSLGLSLRCGKLLSHRLLR